MMKLLLLRLKKIFLILQNFFLLKTFIKHRVMAAVEHNNIFKRDISTLVDVGANRGQFSLAAISKKPNTIIYAFEPLLTPLKTFQEIFKKYKNVKIYNYALGDFDGEVDMHVSSKDDSSSLLKITDLQNEHFPGTQEIGVTRIKVAPLNNLISGKQIVSPAFLKLDVQGFELQALKGCESLLEKFDYIYCECSFMTLYEKQSLAPDIINFLYNKSFNLTGIFNCKLDNNGNCIQADFFFEKISGKEN